MTLEYQDAAHTTPDRPAPTYGVETRTYDVPALDAGQYAFVCTVHPTMIGTLQRPEIR